MIKSMTGFGKTTWVTNGKSITIEIRTLNSKQLDINTKIISLFREKEGEIRNLLAKELQRGKIDLSLYFEKTDQASLSIDTDLVKSYYQTLTNLSAELGSPVVPELFIQTLKMPDVLVPQKEGLSEELWEGLEKMIFETCKKVNEFRTSEGKVLAVDLEKRVSIIHNMIDEIIPYENQRIQNLKEKFITNLSNLMSEVAYDKNRLEEELIYYIEKIDITEEKVRLGKHCDYFMDTMKNEESNGKKLGFIVQEFGREINTIGSKANDFNIQQIVVKMKDEVEKIKEQLANIL